MTPHRSPHEPQFAAPELYDIAYGWNSLAETKRLVKLAERLSRRRVRRALEVGCGTGRVLRDLARLGVEAVGLDRHAGMLAYAAERLRGEGLKGELVAGDMRDFALALPVDLAINPLNGLGYLTDPLGLDRHLAAVARNLTACGVYVCEMRFAPVEPGLLNRPEPWTFAVGGVEVTADFFLRDFDRLLGLGVFETRLAAKRRGEPAERIETAQTLRIWTQEQFYAAVAASPLRLAAIRRRDFSRVNEGKRLTYADDNVFVLLSMK